MDGLEPEQIDLSAVRLTHYKLKNQGEQHSNLSGDNDSPGLKPPSELGEGAAYEPVRAKLSEVNQRMNDLFEGERTDADYLNFVNSVRDKMVENPVLQQQAQANTKEQFALGDFHDALKRETYATLASHRSMAKQVLANDDTRDRFAAILLDLVWDRLQEAAASAR